MASANKKQRRTTQKEKRKGRGPARIKTLIEIQAEVLGKSERWLLYKNSEDHRQEGDKIVAAMDEIEEKTIQSQNALIEHLKQIVKL